MGADDAIKAPSEFKRSLALPHRLWLGAQSGVLVRRLQK